jgi:Family of unknown function (DUF5681)
VSLELAESPANRSNAAIPVAVQPRSNVATRFRQGQSGNPSGRPKSAIFRREAIKQLKREIAANVTELSHVTAGVIAKAADGDVAAYTVLRDTVDGKPGANDGASGNVAIAIGIEFIGTNEK